MGPKIRLQVALAQLGFASRRAAAQIIKAGRVKVNGQVIRQPGYRVALSTCCAQEVGLGRVSPAERALERDAITIDGKESCAQRKVYFLLHKPQGVVSTVKDRHARQSVVELIKHPGARIYPVGRLDKDTSGLLLLTNDGRLAYRLLHPKFGIKKIYQVSVEGRLSQKTLKKLEAGILLEGKKTFPCRIEIISQKGNLSKLEIELSEGRKRQIKKMFAYSGHPVLSIKRIAFASLRLKNLKVSQWRKLKPLEITRLKKIAGVT